MVPYEFCEIFKNIFLQNTARWLLLKHVAQIKIKLKYFRVTSYRIFPNSLSCVKIFFLHYVCVTNLNQLDQKVASQLISFQVSLTWMYQGHKHFLGTHIFCGIVLIYLLYEGFYDGSHQNLTALSPASKMWINICLWL